MDPLSAISLGSVVVNEALKLYARVQELRAKRAAGQAVTPAELDELFGGPALDYDAAVNAEVAKRTALNPDWPKAPADAAAGGI